MGIRWNFGAFLSVTMCSGSVWQWLLYVNKLPLGSSWGGLVNIGGAKQKCLVLNLWMFGWSQTSNSTWSAVHFDELCNCVVLFEDVNILMMTPPTQFVFYAFMDLTCIMNTWNGVFVQIFQHAVSLGGCLSKMLTTAKRCMRETLRSDQTAPHISKVPHGKGFAGAASC